MIPRKYQIIVTIYEFPALEVGLYSFELWSSNLGKNWKLPVDMQTKLSQI
jgi:hypothetical protein